MTINELFRQSDKDIKIYINYRRKDLRLWWDRQCILNTPPMIREFFNILDIHHGFCTMRKRKIKKKIPQAIVIPSTSGGGVAYILKRDIRLRISWDWNVNDIDVTRCCLVENF